MFPSARGFVPGDLSAGRLQGVVAVVGVLLVSGMILFLARSAGALGCGGIRRSRNSLWGHRRRDLG